MTDIPGTGKLQQETASKYEKPAVGSTFGVINIPQMKKEKTHKAKPEDAIWYNKFYSWILFGAAGSLIFAFLAIFHRQFLWLIPIGPIVGALSWGLRMLIRRLNLEKQDELFK